MIRARYRAINTIISFLSRGSGSSFVGALDPYPGAAAVYCVYRLYSSYTGSLLRVRRSSDNTEQDIGYDSNGYLDTASLLDFINETGNTYISDFSSSTDGWTVNNAGGGTVSLTNNSNRLEVDVSGLSTTAFRPALNFPAIWSNITTGSSVTITITGSDLIISALFVDGGFVNIPDFDLNTGTFEYTFTKSSSNTAIIYFDSTGKGDYVGFIDSVTITQTNADGFVTTWYDQSGNSYDASIVAASAQPQIVSSGSVILENTIAALDFNGVSQYLSLGGTEDAGMIGDISVFSVNKNLGTSTSVVVATGLTGSSSASVMQWSISGSTSNRYQGTTSDGTTRINELVTASNYGSQVLVSMINNESGDLHLFADGVASTGQSAVSPMNDANYPLEIGRDPFRSSYYFSGTQQALILYASNQTANITGIESALDNLFTNPPSGGFPYTFPITLS